MDGIQAPQSAYLYLAGSIQELTIQGQQEQSRELLTGDRNCSTSARAHRSDYLRSG